ncbi:hypothetical protein FA95DRAFT_1608901 [Auriscalpium vulgare]|uniref:Uncharacterized protein n=1 Tax=Auriscalpium vulgare TaxID=40419 RepID=A0ACB8RJD5_9AGAM|nr:hypothetical protein FA95DRAFT_1608901 [Auriscalpium vulgare]
MSLKRKHSTTFALRWQRRQRPCRRVSSSSGIQNGHSDLSSSHHVDAVELHDGAPTTDGSASAAALHNPSDNEPRTAASVEVPSESEEDGHFPYEPGSALEETDKPVVQPPESCASPNHFSAPHEGALPTSVYKTADSTASAERKVGLEDEILLLEQRLCNRRGLLNERAPIWRLPPEVLAHIFSFCEDFRLRRRRVWHWFTVSHVCARWRKVALDAGQLWRAIDVSWGAEWIREAARRTRATLTIRPGVGPAEQRELVTTMDLTAINETLDRITSLCLELLPSDIRRVGAPGAPLLEDLTLVVPSHSRSSSTAPGLEEYAPKLSNLTLDGIWFSKWDGSGWKNLVSIHLRHLPDHWQGLYQPEVLNALSQMPLLESVLIDGVPELEYRTAIRIPVKIPLLKRLTLKGEVYWVAAMLTSLDPDPACTSITIIATHMIEDESDDEELWHPRHPEDIYCLAPVFASLFRKSDAQFKYFLVYDHLDHAHVPPIVQCMDWMGWYDSETRNPETFLPVDQPQFALRMEIGTYEEFSVSKAVFDLLDAIPQALNDVCLFDVMIRYPLAEKQWRGLLERVNTVKDLSVMSSVDNINRLAEVFAGPDIAVDSAAKSGNAFVCPQLHTIALRESDQGGFCVESDDDGGVEKNEPQHLAAGPQENMEAGEEVGGAGDAEIVTSDGAGFLGGGEGEENPSSIYVGPGHAVQVQSDHDVLADNAEVGNTDELTPVISISQLAGEFTPAQDSQVVNSDTETRRALRGRFISIFHEREKAGLPIKRLELSF